MDQQISSTLNWGCSIICSFLTLSSCLVLTGWCPASILTSLFTRFIHVRVTTRTHILHLRIKATPTRETPAHPRLLQLHHIITLPDIVSSMCLPQLSWARCCIVDLLPLRFRMGSFVIGDNPQLEFLGLRSLKQIKKVYHVRTWTISENPNLCYLNPEVIRLITDPPPQKEAFDHQAAKNFFKNANESFCGSYQELQRYFRFLLGIRCYFSRT